MFSNHHDYHDFATKPLNFFFVRELTLKNIVLKMIKMNNLNDVLMGKNVGY